MTESSAPARRGLRRLVPYLVMLLIMWLMAEGFIFVALLFAGRNMRAIKIDPAMGDVARIEEYLSKRHDPLGWMPRESKGTVKVDSTFARFSPAFPEPGRACVAVYGDSFAWGSDVGDADAWANRLAEGLNCRVANYGVPGYGIDQALLRFELNTQDEAKWAVLSIFPDDMLRDLTQNVGLAVMPGVDYQSLKPHFELSANGELVLEPIAFRTKEDLIEYSKDPLKALEGDWFHPTGYWARNRYFRFPYVYSMYQMLSGEQFRSIMRRSFTGTPALLDYYRPGHPSRSYELTIALVQRFAKGAASRGKRFLIVMLPEADLVAFYKANGKWAHTELLEGLATAGPTINMGQAFVDALGPRDYREIMHPGGHYTEEGNRMLAARVAEELKKLEPAIGAATATTAAAPTQE